MKPLIVVATFLSLVTLGTLFQSLSIIGGGHQFLGAVTVSNTSISPSPRNTGSPSPSDTPEPLVEVAPYSVTVNASSNASLPPVAGASATPNASPGASSVSANPKTQTPSPSPSESVKVVLNQTTAGGWSWLGWNNTTKGGKCACDTQVASPYYVTALIDSAISNLSNNYFTSAADFIRRGGPDAVQRMLAGWYHPSGSGGNFESDRAAVDRWNSEIAPQLGQDTEQNRRDFVDRKAKEIAGGDPSTEFNKGCEYECSQFTDQASCEKSTESIVSAAVVQANTSIAVATAVNNATGLGTNTLNELKKNNAIAQALLDAIAKLKRDYAKALARWQYLIRDVQAGEPGGPGRQETENPGPKPNPPTLPPLCKWVE